VLANLFLHYAFDAWMQRTYPGVPWCRYADDGLVNGKTETEAQAIKAALEVRFAECGLEMHPEKTHIVYCKDGRRKGKYPSTKFDFLGYTFRNREVRNRTNGKLFMSFNPAVSAKALKSMREKTRKLKLQRRTTLSLDDISQLYNPVLRGWTEYYGRFHPTALAPMFRHFNKSLVTWAMRKFKPLQRNKRRACLFLENIAEEQPDLFVHWERGVIGAFA
jgi:RNA-directed DNA polymerase